VPGEAARRRARGRRVSDDVREEMLRLGGRTGERSYQRLVEAADAYAHDRGRDAARLLRPLRDAMPESPSVRELLGLSLYRLGRYADAAKELETFATLTGDVTQHPVLMDCFRALGDRARVEELWHELGEASPSAELVTEGRIVYAGMLAESGRLDAALVMLRRRAGDVRRARPYHLRLWYALGDLEERAGNLPEARSLFQRVARQEPGFADVAERLVGLG
jgi:tetratricopeptide (TPR) repeat protein